MANNNFRKNVEKILEILEEKYRDGLLIELDYINPYTLLVAVILSAQATDKMVNKVTNELFKIVKSPEDMVNLGLDDLKNYVRSINYYNNKSKNIIEMSKKLIKNFHSKVPNNMNDLTSLNGVGRKTANIILNIVYDIPAIAVDTHVFRVSNRLGIVKADNVLETEKQLMEIIPKNHIKYVNNIFVLFGRYECKALKPKCNTCPIRKYCKYVGNLENSI